MPTSYIAFIRAAITKDDCLAYCIWYGLGLFFFLQIDYLALKTLRYNSLFFCKVYNYLAYHLWCSQGLVIHHYKDCLGPKKLAGTLAHSSPSIYLIDCFSDSLLLCFSNCLLLYFSNSSSRCFANCSSLYFANGSLLFFSNGLLLSFSNVSSYVIRGLSSWEFHKIYSYGC